MWAMEGNRPSIPSMQALSVMFTVFAFKGHDRLGAVRLLVLLCVHMYLTILGIPLRLLQHAQPTKHAGRLHRIE